MSWEPHTWHPLFPVPLWLRGVCGSSLEVVQALLWFRKGTAGCPVTTLGLLAYALSPPTPTDHLEALSSAFPDAEVERD